MARTSIPESWPHWMTGPWPNGLLRPRIVEDASPLVAADMAQLHDQAFPLGWSAEDFEGLLRDPLVAARVIRPISWFGKGPIEGFIITRRASDEGEVLTFAIGRRSQRRGYGGQLLDDALIRLRSVGVGAIFLEVAETNQAAIRLYTKRGFKQVGERLAYALQSDGTKVRALVMRREYR